MGKAITPKQQRFVDEYLVDLNATQAAIRAGYSERTAEQQGPRLLGNVEVAAALTKAQAARSQRTKITADQVLERWWTIATADPNELIEVRRVPCPKCRETKPETREPQPGCTSCDGEGLPYVFAKDSRKLSPAARMLYAGAKQTEKGLEVKLQDQGAALVNVAKHLGMFTERVEHSGELKFTREQAAQRIATLIGTARLRKSA